MSASEKTSLLPSNASGSGPNYYFLNGDPTSGGSDVVRDADGGEVIDIVPEGARGEDFASRPIGQKTPPSLRSMAPTPEPSFWHRLFGGAPAANRGRPYGDVGTLPRERMVPIKVEPKVFFANERTFLAWLHESVLLAGASVGLSFVGEPAALKEVSETSPLTGKVRRGQLVLTVGWADAEELEHILEDSSGTEGRFLLLKNMPASLPDEVIVTLPAGKIGVVIKGTPPSVVRVNPDSPLQDSGLVGMVVDTVTLENGEVTYELEAPELVGILNDNIESEGRVIRFINPTTMELSIPPEIEKPDEMEITLPTGKLSVSFKGKAPCSVSSVAKTSPLRSVLPIGMAVDSLTVGEQIYIDVDAMMLAGLLSSTSAIEGRILSLKNPDVEGVVFQKKPDSVEVQLPSGRLGASLKGSPPMPTKYSEDSPVAAIFPTDMFIDMITMSDGTIMTGLSTPELVAVLADSSEETERTLTFKNPKTKEPSPPGIILPDVKKVRLPSGKIGVFFKGNSLARVSRLQEDSSVRNLLRVGMVVDVLDIPGGKRYAGLTAKEVARILFDTIDVEGRTMILKNPFTAELSPRNIMANDDDSIITEAEDGPDDVCQVG